MKLDTIIAVKNIAASSRWYQLLLGCRSLHGGGHFDVLVNEKEEVLICLHPWGEHQHPTMQNPAIAPGNGLILYFRTENLHALRQNAETMGAVVEEEIHLNPNSGRNEFSLRDPDGYYITITAFHCYEG